MSAVAPLKKTKNLFQFLQGYLVLYLFYDVILIVRLLYKFLTNQYHNIRDRLNFPINFSHDGGKTEKHWIRQSRKRTFPVTSPLARRGGENEGSHIWRNRKELRCGGSTPVC